MTRVVLLPGLAEDLTRIVDHLDRHEASQRQERIDGILHAMDVLADNPMIGRSLAEGLRELIVGRDARGYVALYRYLSEFDTVFVIAIRAQREAGYSHD